MACPAGMAMLWSEPGPTRSASAPRLTSSKATCRYETRSCIKDCAVLVAQAMVQTCKMSKMLQRGCKACSSCCCFAWYESCRKVLEQARPCKYVCSNIVLQAVFICSVPVYHDAGTFQLAINFAIARGGETTHKPCANTCILHLAHSHLLYSACLLTHKQPDAQTVLLSDTKTCLVASA